MSEMRQQLREAFNLIKAGRRQDAIALLEPMLRTDATNADAWWLYANAVTDPKRKIAVLERLLALQPDYPQAQALLDRTRQSSATEPAEPDPFAVASSPASEADPFAAASASARQQPSPATSQPLSKKKSNPLVVTLAIIGGVIVFACAACSVGFWFLGMNADTITEGVLEGILESEGMADFDVDFSGGGFNITGKDGESINLSIDPQTGQASLVIESTEGAGVINFDEQGGQYSFTTNETINPADLPPGATVIPNSDGSTTITFTDEGFEMAASMLSGTVQAELANIETSFATPEAYDLSRDTNMRGLLSMGETVNATLEGSAVDDVWTFQGETGQMVEIAADAASGSTLDPRIVLVGPDGQVIAENDDSKNTLNAYLSQQLPANGTYSIRVSAFGMGGDYALSLR